MKIKFSKRPFVVIALIVCFGAYAIISRQKLDRNLKKLEQPTNRKIITGIVTNVSNVSSPPVYYINYKYECNNANYSGKTRLPDLKDSADAEILAGKTIPIAISVTDCNVSYPLVSTSQYKKMNLPAPDSLGWLVNMFK